MAEDKDQNSQLGYEQTLMYGCYTKELGGMAKDASVRIRANTVHLEKPPTPRSQCCRDCLSRMQRFRDWFFSKVGEDWIFLLVLGICMALLSFAMDYVIAKFQMTHTWLHQELRNSMILQYVAWISFPTILILFSSGFVHVVGPNAIGSGIPEMKTIMRGVVLKEYLSFRTLVSKMFGLTTSLGSGLPLGKEGPFVHVASIVATLLSKMFISFKGIYTNESRNVEMLAAACAVGVACNFAAPIGGVLFSIEVTATYFAVRNYWRGFFSAVCGAFVFRILGVLINQEETLTALFKTNFQLEFPYDVIECIAFALIGVVCGFAGALFVFLHRKIVDLHRRHHRINTFLQKNRFIYPALVALVFATLTFPPWLGQFMAGQLTQKETINELFSNLTWSTDDHVNVEEQKVVSHWKHPTTGVFISLALFIIMKFWMTAVAVTLPVPSGCFIPVFIIGAAFGRLCGECMAKLFPYGIYGNNLAINPGGYSVVGAAALSGSVTHTISTSVIVFELTGQISHILPVMIAVLISNVIAQSLQPSIYDSIIQIKKLPYLPDIITHKSQLYNIYVEDIMIREIRFITFLSTYRELKRLLEKSRLASFPLVDAPESMVLLGSIPRAGLYALLEDRLSRERRLASVTHHRLALAHHLEATGGGDLDGITSPSRGHSATRKGSPSSNRASYTAGLILNDAGDPSASYRHSMPPVAFPEAEPPQGDPKSVSRGIKGHLQSLFGSGPNLSESRKLAGSSHPGDRMSPGEIADWEECQLGLQIDFATCHIDPAPFQLVERTSLHKVHSLFSLLGLKLAYVTSIGRLVGVVSLKEVRRAIEGTAVAEERIKFEVGRTYTVTTTTSEEDEDRRLGRDGISDIELVEASSKL